MLKQLTLRLITTRLFLHSASCVMGLFAWYIVSESHIITYHSQLPIYFDNSDGKKIIAPEYTEITLQGTRKTIQKSKEMGAIHFDSHKFKQGTQLVLIKKENLLLPSAVKVINYNPIEITQTSL